VDAEKTDEMPTQSTESAAMSPAPDITVTVVCSHSLFSMHQLTD